MALAGRARRWLRVLGPGWITGAAADDPATVGTCAQVGASVGYAALWTPLVTYPMMAAVQFICARIGLVTGKGLAGLLRQHAPRWLLYSLVGALAVANTINAGTDIGAVAAALNLFVPIPVAILVVPVALAILALQLWGSYALIAAIFRWLTLALAAYIGAGILARPDLGDVLRGAFVPTLRLGPHPLAVLVALLGSAVSPYLFFWQTGQEVEDPQERGCAAAALLLLTWGRF